MVQLQASDCHTATCTALSESLLLPDLVKTALYVIDGSFLFCVIALSLLYDCRAQQDEVDLADKEDQF